MAIDYYQESEKYRPEKIDTLLIGEATPPSEKKYFYLPTKMNAERPIEKYRSLPATIFNHYFKSRPFSAEEYGQFLYRLKSKNIFLLDILDEPLRIRERSGINEKNYKILLSRIPKLKKKIKNRGISIPENKIIFLLARRHYRKQLKKEFPQSQFRTWKDFRTNPE